MTLDEAIRHAEEIAESRCDECGREHRQLAEWLKDYKRLLEKEPKTGHWIDHQKGRWIYAKCSECETVHDTQTNYCPNCGARMESEDKE